MSSRLRPSYRIDMAVSELQNPVTRSAVQICPPFKPESDEDFDAFYEAFTMWCKAMWMMGRMDPFRLVAEMGQWVHKLPAVVSDDV